MKSALTISKSDMRVIKKMQDWQVEACITHLYRHASKQFLELESLKPGSGELTNAIGLVTMLLNQMTTYDIELCFRDSGEDCEESSEDAGTLTF